MTTFRITAPDGTVYRVEGPEGSTPEQALEQVKAQHAAKQEAPPQAVGRPMGDLERAAFGATDLWHGGAQFLENAVRSKAPGMVDAVNRFNNWLAPYSGGLLTTLPAGGVNEMVKQRETQYAANRAASGDTEGIDIPRSVGAATNPANFAFAGGGATLPIRMLTGAAGGAGIGLTTPTAAEDYWSEKGNQAGVGAGFGAAAPLVASTVARAIKPNTNPDVLALKQAGIKSMTPGQIAGGVLKATEEKATSLPITGDAIKAAQRTGIEEFNRATYRRALEPLGADVAKIADSVPVGNEGIKTVGDTLSRAYEAALDRSGPSEVSRGFLDKLNSLFAMVPEDKQGTFRNAIVTNIHNKVTPANTLTPSVAKDAESELGRLAGVYSRSNSGSEQELGRALRQAQQELRELVAANNPETAPLIQNINRGWANLVQIENAVTLGAKNGVFTPSQYLSAIKRGDNTVRDRAFSRGMALNEKFAQAADNVLSQRYPDSGTTGRAALAWLLKGGLGASGLYEPMGTLGAIAGLSAGAIPYLPGARGLVQNALTTRPESANLLAELVRSSGNYLAPVGAAALGAR